MNSQKEHFDLDRLKAISIVEVARRLGDSLKREGVIEKTTCPWHKDTRPSLALYHRTDENHCYCFSCRNGGSVIDFVMQHENWSFQETCEWLSREFGISTQPVSYYLPRPKPKKPVKPVEPAYTYIPAEIVDKMVSAENSLCRCLMQFFRPEVSLFLHNDL